CLAVVHARELAAEHGTGRHGGDLHPGDLHVDAELRRAVDLVGAVEPLRGRADQLEVFRVLEWDRARHRQKNRGVHQGAVAHAAADTSMVRAVAPARRNCSQLPRTDVEPPVSWTPKSGSAYSASSGGACSSRTWLRSTSSSSASSIGIDV